MSDLLFRPAPNFTVPYPDRISLGFQLSALVSNQQAPRVIDIRNAFEPVFELAHRQLDNHRRLVPPQAIGCPPSH